MALFLDRLDGWPAGRLRLFFGALAAAGTVLILTIWRPFGAPGDLSIIELPGWDPEAERVQAAIALESRDKPAAIAMLREILKAEPDHLVATCHLARALDATGKPEEATRLWQRAVRLADYENEPVVSLEARVRLGVPLSDIELMNAGRIALYERHDSAAAIVAFNRVLARSPNHYGATFQLAIALEQDGKPKQARIVWERVVLLAAQFNDAPTRDHARRRMIAIDAGLQ